MARRTLSLMSQKQVDQAIKNFIVEPNPKSSKVRLCLNGGLAIYFEIYKDYVRAYRTFKQTWVFLGYYYSEDLETDPEINYQMPPAPFYTYDEIISRGEEVKRYGRVISDDPIGKINVKDSKCVNGKLVQNVYTKDYPVQPPSIRIFDPFRPKLLSDSIKEALSQNPAPAKGIDADKLDEEVKINDDEKAKEKETLKELLNRRLRLLDLKIEREEILNQLAAL